MNETAIRRTINRWAGYGVMIELEDHRYNRCFSGYISRAWTDDIEFILPVETDDGETHDETYIIDIVDIKFVGLWIDEEHIYDLYANDKLVYSEMCKAHKLKKEYPDVFVDADTTLYTSRYSPGEFEIIERKKPR